MKSTIVAITSLLAAATAAPDPLITPRAELTSRQHVHEPELVGWIDAINGQFSESRTCDFPATLSSSGSLAQCCASGSCVFWSSCSAATLFAASTSLFCDQGYCNTAVVVPTIGASEGVSFLGCWATSYGQSAFTLVRDIGTAPVVAPSSTTSVSGSASSSDHDSSASSATSTESSAASSGTSGSATGSASSAASSGAATVDTIKPFTGVVGLVAMLSGML